MMENKSWLDYVKMCVGCGSLSARCQFLISGIIFGVIFISWIVIYIIKAKKKNNEETAPQKKPCRLLYWIIRIIVVSVAVILLVNAIITLSEAKHFVVESPLTYSDVILMLIGLAGDIAIAGVTFKVQQTIDEQGEYQQHHLWMAEHFGSIQSSSQTICKGTNLNINKEEEKDYKNGKLLIRIENHSDNGTYLFYPQYFSVKSELILERQRNDTAVFKEKLTADLCNSNVFCLDANKLEIVFGVSESEFIKNALLYPCSNIPSSELRDLNPQAFRFRLDITAEDRSYLINKDNKDMVYKITYTIYFTLTQKSTYGYDDKGTFELVMSDYSISAKPPELVEKSKFVVA